MPADPPCAWRTTPGGSVGYSIASLAAWGIVGQVIPGVVIAVSWAATHQGTPTPEDIDDRIACQFMWIQAASLVGALGVWGILRWSRRLADAPTPAPSRRPLLFLSAWVVGATVACLAAQFLIERLLEAIGYPILPQGTVTKAIREDAVGAFLALVVLAPVAEELIFRRIVLRTLNAGMGPVIAILGSSLAFAIAHGDLKAIPLYLIIGVVTAVAYLRTGQLSVPILIHAANNAVSFALTLSDS
ncbi:MAG: CPBP family intramembrane metalloprotease [Planctomycetes bacterium]|nr:CPBP family intramembrane metalloprotease [Planctomycetota bacterium]